MILDLDRFIRRETPFWEELQSFVWELERDPHASLDFDRLQRFHYLYERAAGGLGKLATYSLRPETSDWLEQLVAAAYAEIQDGNRPPSRFSFRDWFFRVWPATVVRHWRALLLSAGIMLAGSFFGAAVLMVDPAAKGDLIPEGFSHLHGDPSERVAGEESRKSSGEEDKKWNSAFSARLMTHNTQVAVFALCLGILWGVGTILVLFYKGVILGAVAFDYAAAGETVFLLGWLLPHGIVEIPAFLIAGQGGLLLARAVVGWRNQYSLSARMRLILPKLVTILCGVALMLIWAGLIESFLSQDHEPQLPYAAKIAFGLSEAVVLVGFFAHFGRRDANKDLQRDLGEKKRPFHSPLPRNRSAGRLK